MNIGRTFFLARLIATFIILWFIDFKKIILILQSIDLNLTWLAFLIDLAGFIIWTIKWKFLVDKLEKIGFLTLFIGLLAGNCLNTNVLRARTFGGFGRAMFLTNVTKNHRFANWYGIVVMDQTSNSFVFMFPVIFSLLFMFLFLNIPWWLSNIMEILTFFLFFLAFFAFISKKKINRTTVSYNFYSFLQKIYNFPPIKFFRERYESYNKFEEVIVSGIEEFSSTWRSILGDRRILAVDFSLSVIMFAFIYLKAFVLFKSTGYNIFIPHLIVSLTLTLWLSSILPVPKGFGFKEILMIGIYAMVGVPINTALIVSLIDRAIYLFYVIVIAYLSMVAIRIFHIDRR